MCGRYILVQKKEIIEKRFNVSFDEKTDYKPSYNVSPGKLAAVITNENPLKVQMLRFGLTPFWAKKEMLFILVGGVIQNESDCSSNKSGSA